jgi:hypothetical protein
VSVLVTVRVKGNLEKLNKFAEDNRDLFLSVSKDGMSRGAIQHAFYSNGVDEILVVDEWVSEEAFNAFFSSQDDIQKIMQYAEAEAPQITAWTKLDLGDEF